MSNDRSPLMRFLKTGEQVAWEKYRKTLRKFAAIVLISGNIVL